MLAGLLLNVPQSRMKSLMILGSVVGFLIGAGFSLAGGCPGSIALWRASVAALLVALLARWWGRIWLQGLQGAKEQRLHARSIAPVNPKPTAKI
jgi:hypothetical protein